ncbi:sialate O-acetylesterase [Pedobacter frigoris]|uniref:Sialate O-acetylesterase n=2 Tax=Pedobacter frigoris TaxID=2571272 RepID=A0A4U1CQC3_9SPHI|nr:sialate O-acetylesterase [Pedobacter frigoris]
MIRSFLVFCLSLLQLNLMAQNKPLKVACIGNSVTYGYLLKDPSREAYPAVLQNLLGAGYEVGNFGLSGATLLKKGHNPYYKTKAFSAAMDFYPDIAIVHLGLNDTDPRDWPDFRDDFAPDYAWLIATLRKQNPAVKIYICRLTPIFNEHPRFKSGTRDWYWQIQGLIPQIASANKTGLIDLNTPLYSRPDLFPDNLHPDKEGAKIIAQAVYNHLTGNYGGLKLSSVFSEHMVLQRDKLIPVYGMANAFAKIVVNFNGNRKETAADQYGKWRVEFPEMKAGGPFEIDINCQGSKTTLKDILVGDVWLCSGQSNMAFPLNAAATGKVELRDIKENPTLRVLKFDALVETNNTAWDLLTLEKVNQLQYFSGKWGISDAKNLSDFSAVGYYFGKKLVQEENIPIGLIQLAVGGSIIESWIDRFTMEYDEQLVDVLTNWRKSDFIQQWARERADVNLKNALKSKQRHPYEPAYNYEAGVSKLIEYPIKGVIWYQGESNAQNLEQYSHTFPVLVDSWRKKWGYDFPFYYVQLSGIDRASWPAFRNLQRELQYSIKNSGMAVSSDLGDSLNVHPVRKKEIGERLALLALKNTYNKKISARGPAAFEAKQIQDKITVSFTEVNVLKTVNHQPLIGFELVNDKGYHISVKGIIKRKSVIIDIPAGERIKKVLYAWQPFTKANLVDETGLPASTFSIDLKN